MAETADFLVELGTEELPPKALRRLEQAFANGVRERLEANGLAMGDTHSFATPRRLAVLVKDLERLQPARKIEKRGPPTRIAFDDNGKPTKAAVKFAEGFDVSVDALDTLKTDKGEWLVFRGEEPGQEAAVLLPAIVNDALAELPIPKRMRWGSSDVEFVRPAHWLVMMLGNDIVPAEVLGLAAGNQTRGHRFHAPAPITLSNPADYATVLREQGHVIADFAERHGQIRELAEDVAKTLGAVAILEAEVLEEVTALVEWPVPVTGNFAAEFLRLPDEVLIATLQDHQRYFPVRAKDGKLSANFIAMSNLDSTQPDEVRRGNERVVAPRLADAAFFWDTDRKTTLDARRGALADVVFVKSLGSVADKSARVGALAAQLAETLGTDSVAVQRAAALAKTDLLTAMVGEFPKLQGRIGRYYAELDGEDGAVAQAIEEQYLPVQSGGRLPESDTGRLLAIADRLDTLAGIFAAGKRPTGNKDPFGLRRAALGVIRILIEAAIEVDIRALLAQAVAAQPVKADNANLADELYGFLLDRSRGYFLDGHAPGLEAGVVTAEIFAAVRICEPSSLLDLHERITAVCAFMNLDAADSLAAANKRIANILKSAGASKVSGIDTQLFDSEPEQALYQALEDITDPHGTDIDQRNYRSILERLAALKDPVDHYFDEVMVMVDDEQLKQNRLATLSRLRALFLDVADISCIPTR